MTTENNRLNFLTARRLVGQKLFGSDFDGTATAYKSLSAADQTRLDDELAWYIAYEANPSSFSTEQIALATQITKRPGFRSGLANTGYDWGEFQNEFLNNASGVAKNFAVDVSKAISVALVIAAIFAVLKYRPQND